MQTVIKQNRDQHVILTRCNFALSEYCSTNAKKQKIKIFEVFIIIIDTQGLK